ncbi:MULTISPECIES: flagellar motor switch protein FliG [unclassified Sphingomonas]|jgi:flagellar motor switch protein FliG|uniref:flagellar motor switch protein FliG n=1 Tax=unclassified Sphingomonas TaxID=196159 RepID=UPI0006FD7D35|nr:MULTISPECIES: flagellar motor switch protein FliG [unclassified Sphingomonas]KQO05270.1 flagellar motor switch protein FliG [Sphingomonas sp. Leaf242]KQS46948.1 flagellar motor switch protein FliG [Sphingomonas sp. Leaf198]RMB26668.1 flagellar motor switch protein FliG [Sphingomonas sp. PP-F2F-G114-C0414]RMB52321.1 flagellar motor switch protein FliG [Sphingomonas sp. PP-CE-3A-406]TCP72431.1 flagellar motor switch protein FliG [Sphingomonas sp. PP-CE-1G-424]
MTLAEPPELKRYSGIERAAALMLTLGKEHGAPIWDQLSVEEVKDLSSAIAQLGRVPSHVAEHLLVSFTGEVTSMNALHGSYETAERLLDGVLPTDRVREIMEDIRGPAGRTMWDKLSNVSESVLARYLKNEYPQTVAVILSKLKPENAAGVLAQLPQDIATEVIQRMLRMETVQKDVLLQVEQTLRSEFMNNLSRAQRHDPHEAMAEVFNAMDRSTEEAMLYALDEHAPESAERIRALMFTFEDLGGLVPQAAAVIVRQADKRQMALALKGATDEIRRLFLGTMTERSAKLMREDMAAMGPVRARDCEEAQTALVRLAKQLADSGDILLVDPKSNDAMIV